MSDSKTVEINLKSTFTVRQIVSGFVAIMVSVGLLGTGIVQLGGTPNQAKDVIVALNDSLLKEVRVMRADIRRLRYLEYDVETNSMRIDTILAQQLHMRENQEKGFGVLWEQNRVVLASIKEFREEKR